MASEHRRIVDRLDALERLFEDDKELRRVHCDQHKSLEERQKGLESNLSGLRRNLDDHHHASLEVRFWRQMSVLGKRADMARSSITDLEQRLAELDARLANKPDASLARDPDGKWWVIAKKGPPTMIFHPYEGFIRWEKSTEYGWRERWRAREVCDRLFEMDEDVSVQEAMNA